MSAIEILGLFGTLFVDRIDQIDNTLTALTYANDFGNFGLKDLKEGIISSDYEYITAGTSIQIGVTGVSNTGNAAIIPDGAYWRVSDAGIGSVDENGVFTAELLLDDAHPALTRWRRPRRRCWAAAMIWWSRRWRMRSPPACW